MTPHEVIAKCVELGTPITQSTLANYKKWSLIFPPKVQSLGRKVGKVSDYRDSTPCEIYAAQRLSSHDFGFSLDYISFFRFQWLSGGEELIGGQPLDLFVEGGALLWGLLYTSALKNFAFPGQYLAFFYPLERLQQVIDYVRRVEPASLPRDDFSLTGDADWGKARGMVLLRRRGDGHHVLAVLYETGVRVLTCLGHLPEPAP